MDPRTETIAITHIDSEGKTRIMVFPEIVGGVSYEAQYEGGVSEVSISFAALDGEEGKSMYQINHTPNN